ncbi:MAG: carbamoyltransferase [Blastocatellales bacterium]
MYILSISGHHHDAAAALFKDGRIVAAIEEEKLARIRHVGINQCGGLPYQAVEFCLAQADLGIEDIDYVTYYLKPRRLLHRQRKLNEQLAADSSFELSDRNAASLHEFRDRMRTRRLIKRLLSESSKVVAVDHQLAHAASSFYLSGFDRAAILTLGGKGDLVTIATGIGEGGKIRFLNRIEFPNSLGWVYSLVTEYLGFQSNGGERKTQWLSMTGEPEFLPAFSDLIRLDGNGIPAIDTSYIASSSEGMGEGPGQFSEVFYKRFGDCLRRKDRRLNGSAHSSRKAPWVAGIEALNGKRGTGPMINSYRRNLAHSLQKRLEHVVLALAEKIRLELGVNALCLAGGVALNSLLVSMLERESGYKHVFVQPAAGNAGCSLGAALFHWHHQLNGGEPRPLEHVYFGPEYSDEEIKPVLDNCKLIYRCIVNDEKLLDETVELLRKENIVAWFQGRAEFGPRSLGARSILASPARDYMKENLNLFVKHREAFHPFAASIPEERAGEFFESRSPLSSFLLNVSRVKDEKRHLIPAACFDGGLARVHTVSRKTNPLFWRLLNKFAEKTGVPILLNTSFNLLGEPIVCTPREAVRGYYCSGIDALVINRFLLRK